MKPLPLAWLLCATTLACSTARADQPLWELGLGLGALRLPHYRGSDQSRNWLLPVPYFVYRGEFFSADREGARAKLLNSRSLDIDISVDASTPTRSGDNRARVGMSSLAPTLELGPNLNWHLAQAPGWKLDLRLPLRAVFTVDAHARAIGWRTSPVLSLDTQLGGWDMAFQGGPVAADRRYHAYFYDVTRSDANSTRPAYQAQAGSGGWAFTTTGSRRFGPLWVGSYLQTDSLAGAVFRSSPLVRQRNNVSVGVGVSWVFAVSDTRVPDGQ
jgi:outer membrane scaffolding protein for murein synthesis (MipA/OmpV family)